MTDSVFSSGPYATLKVQFLRNMKESIEKNTKVPLETFTDKVTLNSHFDKVSGWKEAVAHFEFLCKAIEEAPASNTPESDSQPISAPELTVTEGEIVE